jgi:hypothetical protein
MVIGGIGLSLAVAATGMYALRHTKDQELLVAADPPPTPTVAVAEKSAFERQLEAALVQQKKDSEERERLAEQRRVQTAAAEEATKRRKEVERIAASIKEREAGVRAIERREAVAAIVARDKRLRTACAAWTSDPTPIEVGFGNGTLTVKYNHKTLYMLTGDMYGDKYWCSTGSADGPCYYAGQSSLYISASYAEDGVEDLGTKDWYKVNGKAHKLTVSVSNEKVIKSKFVPTILEPVGPGEATVTVTLAGTAVSFRVTVVPLDVALGEPEENLIKRKGLADVEIGVHVSWPDSKTVHGYLYYDNLKVDNCNSGTHWKYDRYPGAVIVVKEGSVCGVSTTSPREVGPEYETRRRR